MAGTITIVLTIIDSSEAPEKPRTIVSAVVLHPEYDARACLDNVKRIDGDGIAARLSVELAPWHSLAVPKSLRRRRLGGRR